MEGKTIYNEKLNGFSAEYAQKIAIRKNPKNSYFVKVEQGKHSQLRKLCRRDFQNHEPEQKRARTDLSWLPFILCLVTYARL